jgi:glucose-1-phosphate thymidylyltransferase
LRAVVLAGGYAKRMWPLTRNLPKSLLPLGDRPALDHIVDKLLETDLRSITILTNLRFKPHFEAWLKKRPVNLVEIVAERSRREEEKLGAIGALAELITKLEADDYLIMAGDNIITASIRDLVDFYTQKRSPVLAIAEAKSREDVLRSSSVILGKDGEVVWFKEKPTEVKTMLIGACIYVLPYRVLLRTKEYLPESGNRDEPGGFMEWLYTKERVYGYVLPGGLWDIGTIESYEQLNKRYTGPTLTRQ